MPHHLLARSFYFITLSLLTPLVLAQAYIDPSLKKIIQEQSLKSSASSESTLIDLTIMTSSHYCEQSAEWLEQAFPSANNFQPYTFGAICLLPSTVKFNEMAQGLEKLSDKPLQLWRNRPGTEELNIAVKTLGLRAIKNDRKKVWWRAIKSPGSSTTLGLLDSGIANENPAFLGKTFFKIGAQLGHYINDVRTAHGTGVAGIAVGNATGEEQAQENIYQGIAFGVKTIVSAFAGDADSEEGDEIAGLQLTLTNLQAMLQHQPLADAINYSFGNGKAGCKNYHDSDCDYSEITAASFEQADWSPIARVVDTVVNDYNITWAKSAGNAGWAESASKAPFTNSLTTPADNYNGITVANIDSGDYRSLDAAGEPTHNTPNRKEPHSIRESSSRGPTLLGRKKPDIAAPGHHTRTAAPDPSIYFNADNPKFKEYPASSQYNVESQTRLLTGTSAAAPFISGAALLIRDYANKKPHSNPALHYAMASKALLINSADSWTDNSQPGPHDKKHACQSQKPFCGHGPVFRSEWNPTYGWGYLNLKSAYQQRLDVIVNKLDSWLNDRENSFHVYETYLQPGEKVTLTWHRHPGFLQTDNSFESFPLNQLHLALYNLETGQLWRDDSAIDNVLQVSLGQSKNKPVAKEKGERVAIIVWTKEQHFAATSQETYALAAASPLRWLGKEKNLIQTLQTLFLPNTLEENQM